MSTKIPLEEIPSQSFSIVLDSELYEIAIQAVGDLMAATISRAGVTLVTGERIVAGTPLLPFKHLEKGNFIFVTENDERPWYEKFGTQYLLYLTIDEIATLTS